MARPAPHADHSQEVPPVDPQAIETAYRLHRARREARLHRKRAHRAAHLRFFLVVVVLLAASVLLALTVWREIERLFGL